MIIDAVESRAHFSNESSSRIFKYNNPLLQKLTHFPAFDGSCVLHLEALFSKQSVVPRRRDMVRDGEHCGDVLLLLSGWAARYKIVGDGERQITSFLLPGDVFPIHTLPAGRIDHGIVALTPCRVAVASAQKFDDAVLHNPKLGQVFWWITIQDKNILRAWVVNLGQRDAYRRVAHLICELAVRLEMIGRANGRTFEFPITQQEIADAQGLTPVHTNRMLKQLRHDRLIALDKRNLTILDAPRFREIADFDPDYLVPGGSPPTAHS